PDGERAGGRHDGGALRAPPAPVGDGAQPFPHDRAAPPRDALMPTDRHPDNGSTRSSPAPGGSPRNSTQALFMHGSFLAASARDRNACTFLSKRARSAGSAMLSPASALCAIASENMSGKMRAPRCSSGTRRDQRPRLPPASDGDADRRRP